MRAWYPAMDDMVIAWTFGAPSLPIRVCGHQVILSFVPEDWMSKGQPSPSIPIKVRGAEQRCPHVLLYDFLGPAVTNRLLLYVEERRTAFTPATIYSRDADDAKLDLGARNCLRLWDIGPFKPLVKQAVEAVLPEAMTALGILGALAKVREIEICAYGDATFFGPHIDTQKTGPRRIVSSIYYFFHQPPAFSGGELRFHGWQSLSPTDARAARTIDVRPRCDTLVIFPSWLCHEVRPISCSSSAWRDHRFAINCWGYRPTAPSLAS